VFFRNTLSDDFEKLESYSIEGLKGFQLKDVRTVRDEETDWAVYHYITANKGCNMDMLLEWTGLDPVVITSSLNRLTRYCLVDCREDAYFACNITEIIMKNQIKGLLSDGLELSGGVIRYNPDTEG